VLQEYTQDRVGHLFSRQQQKGFVINFV